MAHVKRRRSDTSPRYTANSKNVQKQAQERWTSRWEQGVKGEHLRQLTPTRSKAVRKLHAGRTKAESALLTQLHTGKIGFNAFLHERKVPGLRIAALRMWTEQDDGTTRSTVVQPVEKGTGLVYQAA